MTSAEMSDRTDLLLLGASDQRAAPVHIDRTFPLDEFNEAMEYVRAGQAHGRVVIRVRGD